MDEQQGLDHGQKLARIVAVDPGASDGAGDQLRRHGGKRGDTEKTDRVGKAVHQPVDGDLLYPCAEYRNALGDEVQAKAMVRQRSPWRVRDDVRGWRLFGGHAFRGACQDSAEPALSVVPRRKEARGQQ